MPRRIVLRRARQVSELKLRRRPPAGLSGQAQMCIRDRLLADESSGRPSCTVIKLGTTGSGKTICPVGNGNFFTSDSGILGGYVPHKVGYGMSMAL